MTMYLFFACVTLAGLAGILLALNFRDSAYRVYELLMNRSPVSPGFGFSPLALRITGAVLGISLIAQIATRL
ncbi:hypothetical protein [Streptomyces halstedii]|uniref:hypothetical protein n=1 Tax=Streptomyces halstedii TaxID=1944 RepID=UPI00365F2D38